MKGLSLECSQNYVLWKPSTPGIGSFQRVPHWSLEASISPGRHGGFQAFSWTEMHFPSYRIANSSTQWSSPDVTFTLALNIALPWALTQWEALPGTDASDTGHLSISVALVLRKPQKSKRCPSSHHTWLCSQHCSALNCSLKWCIGENINPCSSEPHNTTKGLFGRRSNNHWGDLGDTNMQSLLTPSFFAKTWHLLMVYLSN